MRKLKTIIILYTPKYSHHKLSHIYNINIFFSYQIHQKRIKRMNKEYKIEKK